MKIKTIDEHGRVEFRMSFLILASFSAVLINLIITGGLIFYFEHGVEGSNIQSINDAVWLGHMIISTVGFGDHYPITDGGRVVAFFSSIIGAINLGTLITIGSRLVKTDSSVSNRQLYTALAEQTRMMQEMDRLHNKNREVVSEDSHFLDEKYDQKKIVNSETDFGWITSGRDSSGMYVLSIERESNGFINRRWIPADNRVHLDKLFKNFRRFE